MYGTQSPKEAQSQAHAKKHERWRATRSQKWLERLAFLLKKLVIGLLTPQIRISPPRTPLSSSTKLLQELDRQLLALESDCPPEHHDDAPAYEWDDYKVGRSQTWL